MPPSKQQILAMSVPETGTYTLSVNHNRKRASVLLDHLDDVLHILAESRAKNLAALKTQLTYLSSYGKYGNKVKLTTDRKNGSSGWGRLFPNRVPSYVSITRSVRHALAHDLYSDHDIVNCHPEFVAQLFETYTGHQNTNLESWNDNREAYFQTMTSHSKGLHELKEGRWSKVADCITRDDCKGLGFVFLYDGDVDHCFRRLGLSLDGSPPEILHIYELARDLHDDIRSLRSQIRDHLGATWDDLPHDESKGPHRAPAGKFSSLMQHFERHIVLILKDVAERHGFEVGDIAHDGLFLALKGKPALGPKVQLFYKEAEDLVLKRTGFQIRLAGKTLVCPDWYLPWAQEEREDEDEEKEKEKEDVEDDYDTVLQAFNLEYCKIRLRNLWVFRSRDGPLLLTKQELCHATAELMYTSVVQNEKGPATIVRVPFTAEKSLYWRDSNKSMKDNIDVYPPPLVPPPHIYNLWTPFAADLDTPYEPQPEALKKILHVFHVICNHEDSVYEYFLDWTSQLIQFPGLKSNMPVFLSREGAGKGFIIQLFKYMLGENKVLETTDPGRDVWGLFNDLMMHALLVIINELELKDSLAGKSKLKGLITDPTLVVNPKGKPQVTINSHHHFIGCSNKLDASIPTDSNRREWIVRCSDELIPLKEFWGEMYRLIKNPDVYRTVFDFFKTRKGADSFLLKPMPVTEHCKSLQQLSRSIYEEWLYVFITTLTSQPYTPTVTIPSTELFSHFKGWAQDHSLEWRGTNTKFGVNLHLLKVPGVEHKKSGRVGPSRYVFVVADVLNFFGVLPLSV